MFFRDIIAGRIRNCIFTKETAYQMTDCIDPENPHYQKQQNQNKASHSDFHCEMGCLNMYACSHLIVRRHFPTTTMCLQAFHFFFFHCTFNIEMHYPLQIPAPTNPLAPVPAEAVQYLPTFRAALSVWDETYNCQSPCSARFYKFPVHKAETYQ